ncbi:MAG: type II toxin-antitoxin system PemK/MazF family toxin [Epsilonproteobacteria bacterium]|nr:type II toxin-antitoxin system PemK/MazF family toxin [Campylobacterota bacterium]
MKQGEIWLINLNPTINDEIKKIQPCVILNNNTVGKLALKIIAPLTDFKEHYKLVPWMVIIEPNEINGLSKTSTIDIFQVRSLSQNRLINKIGEIDTQMLESCKKALDVVFK